MRRAAKESRIPLKHCVRLLVETSGDYLPFLLGFDLWNQGHVPFSYSLCDSGSPAASPTTLPATERGSPLDNLGGSDPRRRRRWAAPKPLKVGSLPPKKRFSPPSIPPLRRRLSSFFSSTFQPRPRENWPQFQGKNSSAMAPCPNTHPFLPCGSLPL